MSIIVGSVQELIFRTDVDGRLNFLNPYWQRMSAVPLHAGAGAAAGRAGGRRVARRGARRCSCTSGTDGQRQRAGGAGSGRRRPAAVRRRRDAAARGRPRWRLSPAARSTSPSG
jgi:PAS domain-containing protein